MKDLQEGVAFLNTYKFYLLGLGVFVFLFSALVRSCSDTPSPVIKKKSLQMNTDNTGKPADPSILRDYSEQKKTYRLQYLFVRRQGEMKYSLPLRQYRMRLEELPDSTVKEVLGYVPPRLQRLTPADKTNTGDAK